MSIIIVFGILCILLIIILILNNNKCISQIEIIKNDINDIIKRYGVPGSIVAISSPKEIYIIKQGLANIQKNIPIDIDTILPIRSITKSFTIYLILMLASENILSLDDPIEKYIRGIPNGNIITLRQLANMSSGLSDYINDEFNKNFDVNPNKIFTLDELNKYITNNLHFSPGTKYEYINANTNILGAIIEKVTGRTFAEVLENKILKPFGLNNTKYITNVNDIKNNFVTGYQLNSKHQNNMSIYGPSGSMVSTISDQLKWGNILVNGNLLSPKYNSERFIANKFEKGPEYDKYGLGIGELNGWWGHTGDGNGVTILTMHNKNKNITVVIFMNISNVKINGQKVHLPTKLFRKISKIYN